MGYTHYWERPANNTGTAEMYGRLALDAKAICEQSEIPLAGPFGVGKPEFTEGYFSFNGQGPDNDHETFQWQANPTQVEYRKDTPDIFNFTKTARKPYDAVVCAVLIRAKMIYGDLVTVMSDGNWGSDEWPVGIALYEKVALAQGWTERDAVCPFNKVSA